jgi:hypothetical protein
MKEIKNTKPLAVLSCQRLSYDFVKSPTLVSFCQLRGVLPLPKMYLLICLTVCLVAGQPFELSTVVNKSILSIRCLFLFTNET